MCDRYLYRYYSNEDYLLDVLQHKRLYHSAPSEFNDPFDCQPRLNLKGGDDASWEQLLYCLARMDNPQRPKHECECEAKATIASGKHHNQAWRQEIENSLREVGAMVRVCCFTRDIRNMMMWAHYADNHSGVALAFRTAFLRDKASKEYRGQTIIYTEHPPGIEEISAALVIGVDHQDPLAPAKIIYATKTNHWRAENEVRFLSLADRDQLNFQEQALYGIVLGAKCDKSLIRKISSAVSGWQQKPHLFRISLSNSSHKLWVGK